MTSAQIIKYRVCAAQAVRALRKLGHAGTDEELRAWLRRKACGRDVESHRMNNNQFDAFLRIAAGYHSMGDLAEQLRLLEQPLRRVMAAAAPLLDEIGVDERGREAYVRVVYDRIQARRPERGEKVYDLAEIIDDDIVLVVGALVHTAQHKQGIEHQHRFSGRGRARYAHRVGQRKGWHSKDEAPTTEEFCEAAAGESAAAKENTASSSSRLDEVPADDGDPF